MEDEHGVGGKNWMKGAVKPANKGKLRAKLGAKPGKPIPAKKLEKAAKSKNPTLKKEAVLAETFRKERKSTKK
jgi:hypothetical protein